MICLNFWVLSLGIPIDLSSSRDSCPWNPMLSGMLHRVDNQAQRTAFHVSTLTCCNLPEPKVSRLFFTGNRILQYDFHRDVVNCLNGATIKHCGFLMWMLNEIKTKYDLICLRWIWIYFLHFLLLHKTKMAQIAKIVIPLYNQLFIRRSV